MISLRSRPAVCGALCGLLTLIAGNARADVTVENSFSVEGVGMMAVGNMSGTSKTTISGDKSRTDSDIQMKSRIVRMLAHNAVGPSAEIIRLDQDKIYRLNLNKKEYTEMTFAQMREQLKKISDQSADAEQKQQTPSAVDESKCEWLPPKAEVKKTGEKAQIAGYDAERITITASQPCKDKSTGAICEVSLGLDEWLASGFAQSAEVQKFHKAYAQKMGLDAASAQDVSQRAQAMFGRYKGIWAEIATKMQGVKGYPVKSSFSLALGGEQCQNAKQEQSGQTANNDSTPTNPGALASQLGSKLGSLFHKKKDDAGTAAQQPEAPAAAPPPVPPGDVVLMTITSQLISVATTTASADAFDVPAGFTRQEPKTR